MVTSRNNDFGTETTGDLSEGVDSMGISGSVTGSLGEVFGLFTN